MVNVYLYDYLKGFTEQRFPPTTTTQTSASIVGSLLSIASLMVMSATGIYMVQQLNQPSVAFHLTKNHDMSTCHAHDPVFASLVCYVENTVCFFPNLLYTENTTARFFDDCNKQVLENPSSLEGHRFEQSLRSLLDDDGFESQPSAEDEQVVAALWTLLPFYFTIYGATLGWVFELGLLLTGHAFDQSLNRFTSYIFRLRVLNLGPVVASLFFYATALMIPASDVPFLKLLMYTAIFMVTALSIGLYWGGYRVLGGMDMLPLVMLGIQVGEFVFVVRL